MSNAALDEWLKSQVARGCTLDSMIASMQEGGYSAKDASVYVTQAFIDAKLLPASALAELSTQIEWSARVPELIKQAGITPLIQVEAPRVLVLEAFLSDAECDALVAQSVSRLIKSTVIDPNTGDFVPHPERISSGTHFDHQSTPEVTAIENRIQQCFGFDVRQQEAVQILNYQVGGEYKPHFDYFSPDLNGSLPALKEGGQRIATLVMYLNTPTEGGATVFPALGLTVSAKKGNAVYFENVTAVGKEEPKSLHGGAPVITGEKWIATKWIRQHKYITLASAS